MQSSSDHPSQPLSWATIASHPPKKMGFTPTSETSSGIHHLRKGASNESNKKPLQLNPVNEIDHEEAEGKRKKKRKKKKTKVTSSIPESLPTESLTLQEPPKIEDDEEFPNLVFSTPDRGSSFSRSLHFTLSSQAWVKPNLFPPSEKNVQSDKSTAQQSEILKKTARPQSVPEAVERKKTQESLKPKSGGKKSKAPVQLDFSDMLAALEKRQKTDKSKPTSKPVVLSVGSAIPVHSKESSPLVKHNLLKQGKSPHNPLDSSAPLVKKGKQREVPKAKKPSPLKKIILKEREQRKQGRLLEGQEVTLLAKESNLQEQCHAAEDQVANIDLSQSDEQQEVAVNQDDVVKESLQSSMDAAEDISPTTPVSPRIPKVHSRRFREYCNQVLRKEVDSCVTELLKELVRFQDRLFQKDPVKAKVKRRLVMGLREVLKHLKLKKLKCVIISPNCEKIQSKGGLDETLQTIIACACEQNIPFVFALNRKALGRCVNKAVPVSVVGIFSYDGAQDHFHKMCELTMQARQDYKDMISALEKEQLENDGVSEGQTELLASPEEQDLSDVRPASPPEKPGNDDEPEYIKIWKRMLENDYSPYAMYLDDTPASEMLNLHL